MAPQESKLAIVLYHGCYHTPVPYGALLEAFKAQGIDAYCPQLPTSDLAKLNVGDVDNPDYDREPPAGGYPQGEEDEQVVLGVLKPLIDEGKKVLLVAHSAGGWVATEVPRPELQAKFRVSKGRAGGIIGIFYVGAFVIPVGESIHSFFYTPKGWPISHLPVVHDLSPCTHQKHGIAGLGTIVEAEKFLFNDLDPVEARKWEARLTASPTLTTKITNDAYSALPCAYLVLDNNLTLPKEYQEGMAALQGLKTGQFTMYHCPSGHSPHLSWTSGVVETALEFIKKIEG